MGGQNKPAETDHYKRFLLYTAGKWLEINFVQIILAVRFMYNDPVEKQAQQILKKIWIFPIISGTFRKYFTYMSKAQISL